METNLYNIRQKCSWQTLQPNYRQQMWDFFVERRCIKFHDEIRFSFNTIMEQLKHCDSDSFCGCNMSWFQKSCILLLAWQVFDIIFTFFSYLCYLDGHLMHTARKPTTISHKHGYQRQWSTKAVDKWCKWQSEKNRVLSISELQHLIKLRKQTTNTHKDHKSHKLRIRALSTLASDNVPLFRCTNDDLRRHYLLLVQLMITSQFVHLNAIRAQTLHTEIQLLFT